MAKPNYAFEKRQRELEKKKKKEDKALKKSSQTEAPGNDAATGRPDAGPTGDTRAEPPATT